MYFVVAMVVVVALVVLVVTGVFVVVVKRLFGFESDFPKISKLLVSSNFPKFVAHTVVTPVLSEAATPRIKRT